MATMRAAQVSQPNARLELVERDISDPGFGQARVRVQACGVCHSDSCTVGGAFPGISYPISPAHAVAGVIDALGEGRDSWQVGQRVAVGLTSRHCTDGDR